jgi:hypothetical protein
MFPTFWVYKGRRGHQSPCGIALRFKAKLESPRDALNKRRCFARRYIATSDKHRLRCEFLVPRLNQLQHYTARYETSLVMILAPPPDTAYMSLYFS